MNPRQLRQVIERERKSSAEASYDTRRKVIDWLKQNQGATLDDATISMLEAVLQPQSAKPMKDTRKHPNEQALCAWLDALHIVAHGLPATGHMLSRLLGEKQSYIDKWRRPESYKSERTTYIKLHRETQKNYGHAEIKRQWEQTETAHKNHFTTKP